MTKTTRMFRRFRGIDDRTLGAALTNHAQVLTGIGQAVELMLRERRWLNLWRLVVTVAMVMLLMGWRF